MPAQSTKDSDNTYTNKVSGINRVSSFDWFRNYLLPSVSVIFLIIIIFLLGFVGYRYIQHNYETNQPSEFTRQLNELSQKLSASGEQQQFIDTNKRILAELSNIKSGDLQYKSLFNLQFSVSGEYTHSHNPKLREFLADLDKFAKQNYPNLYRASDFSVTCIDEKCGSLNYPQEIVGIKEKIEKSELGLNKQAMLDALYAAAIAKESDKNSKFFYYNLVLQILRNEASKGNAAAKSIVTEMENFINNNFKDQYDQLQMTNKAHGVK